MNGIKFDQVVRHGVHIAHIDGGLDEGSYMRMHDGTWYQWDDRDLMRVTNYSRIISLEHSLIHELEDDNVQ